MTFQPSIQQQALFDWVKDGSGNAVVSATAGSGKAQPDYSKVLTPRGLVRIDSLCLGDTVITPTGTASVSGIFPQGNKPVFRVHFRDGYYADCCEDHLWTVSRNRGNWKTISLKSILADGLKKSCDMAKYQIPLYPSNMNEALLPLDPYLLGYLIGNGSFKGGVPSVSTHVDDVSEIEQYLNAAMPENCMLSNWRSTSKNGRNCMIKQVEKMNGGNILFEEAKRFNLHQHKHIPIKYLCSSYGQRLSLLQGLMDADGSITKNRTSLSSTDEIVKDGVVQLVQSLGGTAIVSKSFRERTGKWEYSVNVKMHVNPFRLIRKSSKWSFSTKNPPSRYISSVEVLPPASQRCIKLNDGVGLYFTDNYIVTHNTSSILQALQFMEGEVLLCAYSKKIATELQKRIDMMEIPFDCYPTASTLHSVGYKAMRQITNRFDMDDKKVEKIVKKMYGEDPILWNLQTLIVKIVGMWKQRGLGLKGLEPDTDQNLEDLIFTYDLLPDGGLPDAEALKLAIKAARDVMAVSNADTKTIDFSDMIWIPLVYDAAFHRYSWILVDECFVGDTPILTSLSGDWMTIRDMVESEYTGPIVSWKEGVGTVMSRVIGGKKTERKTGLKKISFLKKDMSGKWGELTRRGKFGQPIVVCTEGHMIKTADGWTAAKDLTVGQTVYMETAQPRIASYQHRYKIGSVGLSKLSEIHKGNTKCFVEATVQEVQDYDSKDQYVYDLCVEDTHCYFAHSLLVHNCQDLNPTRRELIRRMVTDNTRVVSVGDRRQAIFGFTGSDNTSMDTIMEVFQARELPLSTSFRCPKAVVAHAQKWVSHIEAFEGAKEGSVTKQDWKHFLENVKAGDAVLCRFTAPLVTGAFTLIKQRIPAKVEGRAIGQSIIDLAKKWKMDDLDALYGRIQNWAVTESQRLITLDREHQVQMLEDKIETLGIMIDEAQAEGVDTQDGLVQFIDKLFGDDLKGVVTFCSAHRSKGLEWDKVWIMGREEFMPAKFAKQNWQIDQENNLIYVAVTRSMNHLVEIPPPPSRRRKR